MTHLYCITKLRSYSCVLWTYFQCLGFSYTKAFISLILMRMKITAFWGQYERQKVHILVGHALDGSKPAPTYSQDTQKFAWVTCPILSNASF